MQELADLFRSFANRESAGGASALYTRLANGVADDPEVLALTVGAQRAPNLLMAAVHRMILRGLDHPLAAHYAPGAPDEDPYPLFREVCLAHADEVRETVTTHLVQTNEVARTTALLPALPLDEPLALIEIGASAGLNLLLDRYRFAYSDGQTFGGPSPVTLRCEVQGDVPPPVPARAPVIVSREGIDLRPIDPDDEEQTLWLRALVWPDERDRMAVLEAALSVARAERPTIHAGDALDLLGDVLASVPDDVLPVVFHTFTLWAFSPEDRARLYGTIAASGRDVAVLSAEWLEGDWPGLRILRGGEERRLAECDGHGGWIKWHDFGHDN